MPRTSGNLQKLHGWSSRMTCANLSNMVTAVADAYRLPAWLDSVLNLLSSEARTVVAAPPLPEALRPLVELSRDVLGARDVADLRVRLDSSVMGLRQLSLLDVPNSPRFPIAKLPQEPSEDSMLVHSLGMNGGRNMLRAVRELDAAIDGMERCLKDTDQKRQALVLCALCVRPWSLHDGLVVPHALVEWSIAVARGVVAFGALLAALTDGRHPEPWLTSALTDSALESTREVARLLASAGYCEAPKGCGSLFDVQALFGEAIDAEAAFRKAFEADVRAGCVGVPEDE
jgi:hypothetical protein